MSWLSYSSLIPPNLFIVITVLGVLLARRRVRLGLAKKRRDRHQIGQGLLATLHPIEGNRRWHRRLGRTRRRRCGSRRSGRGSRRISVRRLGQLIAGEQVDDIQTFRQGGANRARRRSVVLAAFVEGRPELGIFLGARGQVRDQVLVELRRRLAHGFLEIRLGFCLLR